MRTVSICFAMLQVPRFRIHALAKISHKSFHAISGPSGNNYGNRLLASANRLEGGYSRRWIRISTSSKPEGMDKNGRGNKPTAIKHEILDERVSSGASLDVNKTEVTEFEEVQYCSIGQKVFEDQEMIKATTVIVFDIETTGFSRENERIIEIALQDLSGGKNSTFQTLVNPGRLVPNSHVHGITTHMVRRPDVPRMDELIPILLQYIRSRQKPGGHVLLVAHNARSFDVPFLIREFQRNNVDIPSDWRFLDTIPLARESLKSEGSKIPLKLSQQALRERYGIPLIGSAHRAMADVNSLSFIFQRLTFDLNLSRQNLIQRSFRASDLVNGKKKSSR